MSKEELQSINGGSIKVILGVCGIVSFLIGVIDGYIRPLKCNK